MASFFLSSSNLTHSTPPSLNSSVGGACRALSREQESWWETEEKMWKCSQAHAENRFRCSHTKEPLLKSHCSAAKACSESIWQLSCSYLLLQHLQHEDLWDPSPRWSIVNDLQAAHSVTGLIWDSCALLLPKGAGRPQWLRLMICGKYLMLAHWSGDILDTQPWIMDPFRDEAWTSVSKALKESRVTSRDLSKTGTQSRGLAWPALKNRLKMNKLLLSEEAELYMTWRRQTLSLW